MWRDHPKVKSTLHLAKVREVQVVGRKDAGVVGEREAPKSDFRRPSRRRVQSKNALLWVTEPVLGLGTSLALFVGQPLGISEAAQLDGAGKGILRPVPGV